MANRRASVRKRPAAQCLSMVPAGTPHRYLRYPVEALTSMCVVDMVVVVAIRL